jgi:hypothetical protein
VKVSPSRSIPFHKTPSGLYAYNTFTKNQENKQLYTAQQFQQAKKAREINKLLGTPSLIYLKAIIQMKYIKNPITAEGIKFSENIFAPDICSLKGKTVSKSSIQAMKR